MDLLTGYGSDVSGNEDVFDNDPAPILDSAPVTGGKQGVLNTSRQAQQTGPGPGAPDGKEPSKGAGVGAGLWAQLPRPTAASSSAPSTSGLSSLPPPSGVDGRGTARKVITMQLPFHKELLAAALDSDDEDEPAAKRTKTTSAKSSLMDFLPPPKYDRGTAKPLGAASNEALPPVGTGKAAATGAAAAAAPVAGGHGALPGDFFSTAGGDGGDEVSHGNGAYRIRDDFDGPHPPSTYADTAAAAAGPHSDGPLASHHHYGVAYAGDPSAAYFAHDYGGSVPGPPPSKAAAAAAAAAAARGPEDLLAEALRAEQERASKRGGGGGGGAGAVKLVEINAKDLTHMDPAAREAANSARDALGPEYSLSLRRSAAPFEGSKMARRKHQIGTLLFNARMQELEQMEKRSQGQKSKAETAAKYGW